MQAVPRCQLLQPCRLPFWCDSSSEPSIKKQTQLVRPTWGSCAALTTLVKCRSSYSDIKVCYTMHSYAYIRKGIIVLVSGAFIISITASRLAFTGIIISLKKSQRWHSYTRNTFVCGRETSHVCIPCCACHFLPFCSHIKNQQESWAMTTSL